VDDFNRIILATGTVSVVTFATLTGRGRDRGGAHGVPLNGSSAIALQMRKQSGTTRWRSPTGSSASSTGSPPASPRHPHPVRIDQPRFIRRSFEDIRLHLLLGGLLASLVVYLFIRKLRITFIAALAVPSRSWAPSRS